MSRTYKYPRESSDNIFRKDRVEAELRIKKRLERQKQRQRKKAQIAHSKNLAFRNINIQNSRA